MSSGTSPLAKSPDNTWEPRIIALVCNWCTYAGADMAGTSRISYPANVRVVRFPCTGRISPLHIIKAFSNGADGVMVSGCHPGDCHYVQGNLVARRRAAVLLSLMELLGLDERRLHFFWVSASEGIKWSRVVSEVTELVRKAGPLSDWNEKRDPDWASSFELSVPDDTTPHYQSEENLDAVNSHLKALASKLLEDNEVQVVIGYTQGSLPNTMIPTMISNSQDVDSLGWNEHCLSNLSSYLGEVLRHNSKAAIVLKKCDCKTVIGLLQENQIKRENITIIGIPCNGVWENGELQLKCYSCNGEVPPIANFKLTPEGAEKSLAIDDAGWAEEQDARDTQIAEIMKMPRAERWQYWQNQFERCLRCYACRGVCPLCYCSSCISDKHQPQWVPATIDGVGNMSWNVVRAFHLAGRCIGCDECSRVCPADIRLDLINRHLASEVEKRFQYHIGEHASDQPLSTVFRMDDPEEFIK